MEPIKSSFAVYVITRPCRSLHDNLCGLLFLAHLRGLNVTLSNSGCAAAIKHLAVHRSAYSFDPLLQIDVKVSKGRGHKEPFSTESK